MKGRDKKAPRIKYPMTVRELIKLIERDGWTLKDHDGSSHRQFTHPTKLGKVTINGKPSDQPGRRLYNSILKQAGLK